MKALFFKICTARFPQGQNFSKIIRKSAEINIYPLCLVVIMVAHSCPVLKFPQRAFLPFATFCRSV